jgi:subtilisin family serine protease
MKRPFAKLVPLSLILAGLLVACPPPPPKPAVILRPQAGAATGVSVAVKSKISFVATDDTGKPVAVNWDRSPAVGSIDAGTGEFTAPDTVPTNPIVTIQATSKANPSDKGSLDIRIIEQGTAGISGKVTVNPSLLASVSLEPATRASQARAINSGVVDWNAPHVKGIVLLVGANSRTRAASLRGVQVRNVTDTLSSLSVPTGETEQAFAARVAQETGLIAQPEYIYRPTALPTPNDTNYDLQDYLVQIDAQAGWAVQQNVTDNLIAVLDTGIKTDHEDLIGRFTPGKDFCATFNGAICVTEDNDPSDLPALDGMGQPVENAGHGTATAGIITAATNNGKGVSGLTWDGKILVVKVFGYDDQGAASPTTTLAKAIKYAADQGSKVINLSLGIRLALGATDVGIDDAITYAIGKGVTIISAAGNSNEPAYGVYYPARNPNVIAVGSVNQTNGISSFSARGPQLALVAPGGDVVYDANGKPSIVGGILSTNFTGIDKYAKSVGTSEATPQVAAVAGLILSKNPALTRVQVRDILTSTARNLGAANTFGAGLLQAGSALRKAANPSAPPPAKTTIYVYADFYDGTKYDPKNPKSGRVVVDLENAVGNTTYTLTAKRGGFSSLETGTYRLVACVNKNSNALACDGGDLGGQKDGVVYNGSTPVSGADITLTQIP